MWNQVYNKSFPQRLKPNCVCIPNFPSKKVYACVRCDLNTSGHCKPSDSDLRSLWMMASPLEWLSFPERQTISPCQRAGHANGFSVKDVRALVVVAVGAWKKATHLSALIAVKTSSSWVYRQAGGTGALWEVLLSWPWFLLLLPPSGPEEVGCKMDTRWKRHNREAEQEEEGAEHGAWWATWLPAQVLLLYLPCHMSKYYLTVDVR